MKTLLELVLFVLGFLLGLWYATMILLPLFYGIPKALVGYFRRRIALKVVFAFLVAPLLWTALFFTAFLGLAFLWNSAFEYLLGSRGFDLGLVVGIFALVVNALFSKKSRADMKSEFDELVLPYRK